jgi:hypothetical protein
MFYPADTRLSALERARRIREHAEQLKRDAEARRRSAVALRKETDSLIKGFVRNGPVPSVTDSLKAEPEKIRFPENFETEHATVRQPR